jgi:hypothetical protein
MLELRSPTRPHTSFNRMYRNRGGCSIARTGEGGRGTGFLTDGFAGSGFSIGTNAASYSALVSDNVPIPGRGIKTRSTIPLRATPTRPPVHRTVAWTWMWWTVAQTNVTRTGRDSRTPLTLSQGFGTHRPWTGRTKHGLGACADCTAGMRGPLPHSTPQDPGALHVAPHDSHHVGLNAGNSFDHRPMSRIFAWTRWRRSCGPASLFRDRSARSKNRTRGEFELKLFEGKRAIFAGLPVNVRICLDQGDW